MNRCVITLADGKGTLDIPEELLVINEVGDDVYILLNGERYRAIKPEIDKFKKEFEKKKLYIW